MAVITPEEFAALVEAGKVVRAGGGPPGRRGSRYDEFMDGEYHHLTADEFASDEDREKFVRSVGTRARSIGRGGRHKDLVDGGVIVWTTDEKRPSGRRSQDADAEPAYA